MKKLTKRFTVFTGCLLVMMLIITSGVPAQHSNKIKQGKSKDSFQNTMLPPAPDFAQRDYPYTVIKQDFLLTLRDGVKLDCSKFYPSEANPNWANGYPAVIMVHGYGDRKETLEGFANSQAAYGYVTYTYSVRGQGNSQGLSNMISDIEADDLIEFVNYVKHDPESGLDSSKVLIMGGSQGGITPYKALCRGMKVNSIISSVATPEFATSWIENGSIKMSYLWTISYTPDTARYNNLLKAMEQWVYASGVKSDKWDSLAYWMPIGRDFKTQVSLNTTPIMSENSWQDYFFNAKGTINSFPFINAQNTVYMGAVMGHGGDTSYTENQWHMNYFNDFFFYYLWGINNGFPQRAKYNFAYTTYPRAKNMWSFVHDSSAVWPPTGMTTKRYYFNNNNRLTTTANTNNTGGKNFNNVVKNNYTLTQIVDDEFKGTRFNKNFKKREQYFEIGPLTANMKMVGTPKLNLDYSSNADICQYNFQIYEISATNDTGLVTRINYTDRKYTANLRKTVSIEGLSHAHIFKAGSRIRIVMTNLDRAVSDTTFLEQNPFVLPVMKNSTNKLFYKNSYIDLPVFTTANSPMADVVDLSQEVELEQNFPNPFNPVTNISYFIPKNYGGLVTIKIYDILGREVRTLLNEFRQSGNHTVLFNASDLSSGIYYYQLTVGEFKDIKKMMLIK